jgi:hypothetical protein
MTAALIARSASVARTEILRLGIRFRETGEGCAREIFCKGGVFSARTAIGPMAAT